MDKKEIGKRLRKISYMDIDENCVCCNTIMKEINNLIEEM